MCQNYPIIVHAHTGHELVWPNIVETPCWLKPRVFSPLRSPFRGLEWTKNLWVVKMKRIWHYKNYHLLPILLLMASWAFCIPRRNSWSSGLSLCPLWKNTSAVSKSPNWYIASAFWYNPWKITNKNYLLILLCDV